MKRKLLFISLSLILIQPALAVSSRPERCPSVAAIAAVGVDTAGQGTQVWMAFPSSPSNYDTKQAWSFGIFVTAANKTEALEKARASIGQLSLADGPYHDDDNSDDLWTCAYGSNQPHVIAYAFTPPIHVMKIALKSLSRA